MLRVSVFQKAVVLSRAFSARGERMVVADALFPSTSKATKPKRETIVQATPQQILALSPSFIGIWHNQESLPILEGNFYDGEFVDGLWHGKGKLHLKDGTTYEGDFLEGRRNGEGTLINSDGSRVTGIWHNGILTKTIADKTIPASSTSVPLSRRHTKPAATPRDPSRQNTSNEKLSISALNTQSTYISHADATIVSTPITTGSGTASYSNGDVYTGDWLNGQKHGVGVLSFGDGGKYEGEWRDNLQHGQGTATHSYGVYTGEYVQGHRHGQGTLTYTDNKGGCSGQFLNGKLHNGSGRYLTVGGIEFTGFWVNGKLDGQGRIYSNKHSYSEGEFKQGLVYNGVRVYIDATRGEVFKVKYADGVQVHKRRIVKL